MSWNQETYQVIYDKASRINERPLKQCLEAAEQLIALSIQSADPIPQIQALILKAKILERMHLLEQSIACIEQVEQICPEDLDPAFRFEIHLCKKRYLRLNGEWDLALFELLKALELDLPETHSIIYYGFSIIYHKTGDFQTARHYLSKSLQSLDDYPHPEFWINSKIQEGMIMTHDGKYEEARALFYELMDQAREMNSTWHECVLYNCLANIHINLKEYKEASDLCRVMLPKTTEFNYNTFTTSIAASIALIAYLEGDSKKSVALFLEAIHRAKRINHIEAINFSRINLAKIYNQLGEHDQAYALLSGHIHHVQRNQDQIRIKTFSNLIASREKEIERIRQSAHQIELQNEQLKRWNEDFKQYSFILAHDLKEPIRNVSSFSSLLEMKAKGELSPHNIRFLQQIQKAAKTMNLQLDSLLKYLEIEKEQDSYSSFDLAKYLERQLDRSFFTLKPQDQISVSGDIPTVEGHPQQLKNLFNELILNAIKFRNQDAPLTIEIKYSKSGGFHRFAVRDNGQGISSDERSKIFHVFKKLGHSKEKSQGMGLAICQRIVNFHGGMIEVESTPMEGSTFFVFLPLYQDVLISRGSSKSSL